jgi:hypothetical protein
MGFQLHYCQAKYMSCSHENLETYIKKYCDKFESELSNPFTRSELLRGISSLGNNKASTFDQVCKEMLKSGKLKLFNKILTETIYTSPWKLDILSPLHKSGGKPDPGNYRGVARVCQSPLRV